MTFKPLRLLLLISSMNRGGAERVMSLLANGWAVSEFEVYLATISGDPNSAYVLDERISRISLGLQHSSNSLFGAVRNNVERVRSISRTIRQIEPDVIVSFGTQTNVLALLANLRSPTPIIVSERVDPTQHREPLIWQLLRKFSYRHAASVVVQTNAVQKWAIGLVGAGKVKAIPNPVNTSTTSQKSVSRTRTILAMGRLVRQKGFDRLLIAYSESKLARHGWQLTIVGDGPERDNLRTMAIELGIEQYIQLNPATDQPEHLFAEAGMFVLSSRYEGFPNVLLEAMAAGTPCIAFSCRSGPEEIIIDGVNGILVADGDTRQLAEQMYKLGMDAELQKRLSARAVEIENEFSIEKVASAWNALLKDVLQLKAPTLQ